jgi:hypothetical protein
MKWIGIEDAACGAGVSVRTIKRWLSQGRLRHRKVRGRVEIDPISLKLTKAGNDWRSFSTEMLGSSAGTMSVHDWMGHAQRFVIPRLNPRYSVIIADLFHRVILAHGYRSMHEMTFGHCVEAVRQGLIDRGIDPIIQIVASMPAEVILIDHLREMRDLFDVMPRQ